MVFNGAYVVPGVDNLVESLKFPYSVTLSEIYDTVFQIFLSQTTVSGSDVRLLLCRDFTYSIMRSFTEEEMQKVIPF